MGAVDLFDRVIFLYYLVHSLGRVGVIAESLIEIFINLMESEG